MRSKYPKSKNDNVDTVKFMQTISKIMWNEITTLSNKRGISVQDYIRAIVIPDHLESLPIPIKKYSKRAKKAWATRRKNNRLEKNMKDDTVPIAPPPWEVRKEPLPSDQSP